MAYLNNSIEILKLDRLNYYKFRSELKKLYVHSFTSGELAQLIDEDEAEAALYRYFDSGWVVVAIASEIVIGVIAAIPLKLDDEFPAKNHPDINIKKSIYIAEVMVHENFRGEGLATKLIEYVLEFSTYKYSDAVIRVWDENTPALKLYNKLGFCAINSIKQYKTNLQGINFVMNKLYLHKVINTNE